METTLFEHSKAQNKPSMPCLIALESSFKNNKDLKICTTKKVCSTNVHILDTSVVNHFFRSIKLNIDKEDLLQK